MKPMLLATSSKMPIKRKVLANLLIGVLGSFRCFIELLALSNG
jgi:hypothetical protein